MCLRAPQYGLLIPITQHLATFVGSLISTAILGFAVGSLSYKFELWRIIWTYPAVPMSTTKVVMQIISTFVGYNVLHVEAWYWGTGDVKGILCVALQQFFRGKNTSWSRSSAADKRQK